MAAWPGSLPQYFDIGVKDTRQQGFIRSENSTGPSKQRKRFTSTTRTLSGSMLLTGTQRATFETFYTTTINEGADEFTFIDPMDETVKNVRFTKVPEFTGTKGDSTSAPRLWRLMMSLEVVS